MKRKLTSVFAALVLPLCIVMLQCRTEAPEGSNGKSIGRGAGNDNGFAEKEKDPEAALENPFADNRVLVVLNKSASMDFRPYTPKDFAEIDGVHVRDLTQLTMEVVQEQLKAERTGNWESLKERIILGMLVDVDKFRRILALDLPVHSTENVLQTIKLLEQREDILYAGPDYFMEFCAQPNPLPSDYSSQWPARSALSLEAAWDIVTDSSVMVGIIDSGIKASHPALSERIDYDASRAFVGGNPFDDPQGHGTKVAGIIGANGTGVIGVCWGIELVSLKVTSTTYRSPTATRVMAALDHSTGNSISIVNFSANLFTSLSGTGPLYSAIYHYPGIFICSAGNDRLDNDVTERYPSNWTKTNHSAYAELTNLITVGALNHSNNNLWVKYDNNGNIIGGSNKGNTTVDLFAPGEYVYTTTISSSGYGSDSATSFATPFVTGVAALVKALHPGYFYSPRSTSSGITAAEIKAILLASVDGTGFPCKSGGRLSANNAVRNLRSNGTSINGRTIVGSININFQNFGTIGKFHLFSNGTWVIAPRGVLSSPISYSPSTHPNYLSWGTVPSSINIGYDFFNLLVPVSTSSGPYYNLHKFTFSMDSSSGVHYGSLYSYGVESLPPGEKRLIRVSGSGLTNW